MVKRTAVKEGEKEASLEDRRNLEKGKGGLSIYACWWIAKRQKKQAGSMALHICIQNRKKCGHVSLGA